MPTSSAAACTLVSLLTPQRSASASAPQNALLLSSSGRVKADILQCGQQFALFLSSEELPKHKMLPHTMTCLLSSGCGCKIQLKMGHMDELPCKYNHITGSLAPVRICACHDRVFVGQGHQDRCCQPGVFAQSCYGRITQPWR